MAHRRKWNVDAVQPVIQVEPKASLLHQPCQRAVRRDDNPRVDAAGRGRPDTFDRELLDRSKELGLCGNRQVRHLVQEERPHVRPLELAAPPAHARRRALLDAEQFRFQKGLDDRRTVDRDKRCMPPAAQLVDLARDELLSGAGLSSIRSRPALLIAEVRK